MSAVVRVNVGSGYDVEVGAGLLQRCGERIARTLGPRRAFVVTDANVGPLYLRACLDSLTDAGFTHASLALPAGEGTKNLSTFGELLEAMAHEGMGRTDIVFIKKFSGERKSFGKAFFAGNSSSVIYTSAKGMSRLEKTASTTPSTLWK